MKSRILYIAFLLTSSSLLANYSSYGSDQGQQSPTQHDDIIQKAITKQAERGDTDIGKRTQKRSEARELQKKARTVEKKIKGAAEPMHDIGMAASTLAYASGDPHARLAAMALNITIFAIEGLGRGIARTVTAVGRYQERIQDILSNIELLIEDLQKTTDKINALKKSQKELLDVGKDPEPSTSSSRLKQVGQGLLNTSKSIQNKVRQATDVLTNDKAKREEKLKVIQADLKVQNENYAEIIRLLQIKLLQDAVEEIDKKINVDQTISNLEVDTKFYQKAKNNVSQSKSQQQKQMTEIQKEEARTNRELVYYLKFKNSPTETDKQLQEQRSSLIDKIKELTQLTKMGESIYLQERGMQVDSQASRAVIVGLYKEIDAIKTQLNEMAKTQAEALKNDAASQGKPLPQTTRSQTEASQALSKEAINTQREALRRVTQGKNQ